MKFGAEIVDFKDSKFYNANFSDKLLRTEARPKEDDPSKVTLALVFEDADGEEKELWLWGLEKTGYRKDPKDGKLRLYNNTSTAAGRYLQSLKQAGIDWDVEPETGGIPTKIGTRPDITGKINNMVIVETTENTKNDEKKTYLKWGLQSVEGVNPRTSTSPQQPAAPKVDASSMNEKWKEFLAENLTTPTNEAGIIKLVNSKIPDATARKPYSETRKAALTALVTEGFLSNDEGKFSVA